MQHSSINPKFRLGIKASHDRCIYGPLGHSFLFQLWYLLHQAVILVNHKFVLFGTSAEVVSEIVIEIRKIHLNVLFVKYR